MKLINLDEGEQLVSLERVAEEPEDTAAEDESDADTGALENEAENKGAEEAEE